MDKLLFLMPRLDVTFKQGPVPIARGFISPIREHWARFAAQVLEEYTKRGTKVDVLEKPLWQFDNADVQAFLDENDYDAVFIPHKEKARYPIIGKTKPYYYMQTQFPWLFSVDPLGWGSGASAYPFLGFEYAESSFAFNNLRQYCLSGKSKFDQPQTGSNIHLLPDDPYVFFPCQLPHDETIKYHSRVGVETALAETILATGELNMPLVVKGHPVNPGSMEPLRRLVEAMQYRNDRMVWIDDINIQDVLARAHVTVTVNSGVGFESLLHEVPVIAFGEAEYDVVAGWPGANSLKFRQALREPWRYPLKELYGFFTFWYNWCYDTGNRATFAKLPT